MNRELIECEHVFKAAAPEEFPKPDFWPMAQKLLEDYNYEHEWRTVTPVEKR